MTVRFEHPAVSPADLAAERQAMLARRLVSWLASQPAPEDIVDTLYQIARRLDDAVPGGLSMTNAHLPISALCRCLFYCDLDDFLAIWPAVKATR